MPIGIGTTLGHYRIVEQIGAGGMGVIYRANDERAGRTIKHNFTASRQYPV
jgi:hypothetical protein